MYSQVWTLSQTTMVHVQMCEELIEVEAGN